MNDFFIKNIFTIGDTLAIPFFALLTYYFYTKKNKTFKEKLFLLFSISAIFADSLFVYFKITKNPLIQNFDHYSDILAIPFFALLTYYFYKINNKTLFEKLLFLFVSITFFIDIFFTYLYYIK